MRKLNEECCLDPRLFVDPTPSEQRMRVVCRQLGDAALPCEQRSVVGGRIQVRWLPLRRRHLNDVPPSRPPNGLHWCAAPCCISSSLCRHDSLGVMQPQPSHWSCSGHHVMAFTCYSWNLHGTPLMPETTTMSSEWSLLVCDSVVQEVVT